MKLLFLIFLLCFSTSSTALSRSGPPPTLFDYIDRSELFFFGIVDEVKQGTTEGAIQEPYTLAIFNSAQYIDGSGIHTFDSPVYIQIPGKWATVSPDTQVIYLLNDLQKHPRSQAVIRIEGDTVSFNTEWDGRGIIQHLDEDGVVQFRKPYHSCKILNPLFELKQYECRMGDQTIETFVPEDTDPPLTVDQFLELVATHLDGKKVFTKADFSRLYEPSLTPMLRENDLLATARMDAIYIQMLETVPLPEKLIEQLNRRERARGNKGDYRNDPVLVEKYAALDAQNQIQFDEENRIREEQERLAQQEQQRLMELEHEREIEQYGPAIQLNQAEASLSIDVSQLPNCDQLWRSLPLKGDNYYIGNCVRMDGQSVCTLVASTQEAGDNCTPLSGYVGGIITPPPQAFQPPPGSPWTSSEIRILYYGAGMPPEEVAVVRQPSDAPPLFIGATPTQWNIYLRQVKTIPISVPDELR